MVLVEIEQDRSASSGGDYGTVGPSSRTRSACGTGSSRRAGGTGCTGSCRSGSARGSEQLSKVEDASRWTGRGNRRGRSFMKGKERRPRQAESNV